MTAKGLCAIMKNGIYGTGMLYGAFGEEIKMKNWKILFTAPGVA